MKEHNQEKKNQQGYNGDETIHKRKANVYENTAYGIDGDNVRKKSSITNMDRTLKQNMALHFEPSKSKFLCKQIVVKLPCLSRIYQLFRFYITFIVTATTQTANVRSLAHKTNNVALPIGLSDIVVRPRRRPHNITDTKHSTDSPIIATTTSLLATPKHTNVFGSVSEVSNITPRPVDTTYTPTFERTPSLLATPQHSNVVASSSGVSKITPGTVGRPRKLRHTTNSTHTPIIATTPSLLATPHDSNVVSSSTAITKDFTLTSTPRPRGRPPKSDIQKSTTKTFANTSTPACHPVREQLNIVESSNTISDISLRRRGRPRKVHIPTPTRKTPPISTTLKGKMPVNNQHLSFRINTPVNFNIGSTSGTHQEKEKSVRMKSSRRINFNDTDDEDEDETELQKYRDHGDPIFGCESCGALLWHAESTVGNTHANSESYSLCCGRGKVMLPKKLKNPPKLLMDLINKKHQKSTTFIDNIRRYNSMFVITSMGGKQDKSVNTSRGPYCYRIQGMNCHRMGALLPDEGKPAIFSQLYIYDTENEIENRIKFTSNGKSTSSGKRKIDHQLTTEIRDMLDINNPLVAEFWMADRRKYNLPTAFEVAALIIRDFDSMEHKRDIILEEQGGDLQRISELHPSYLALKYPLLFSYTEDGYCTDIYHRGVTDLTPTNKKTRQFLVDGYTMVESKRMSYIRREQKDLRSETYSNLAKLAADPDFGVTIRDLFITFTCNPNWPDIARFVAKKGLKSDDRPDVITRVFKQKLDSLMKDFKEKRWFGRLRGAVYTVEFQKRGLPHAHILLFLEPEDKLTTTGHIDKYISAEIPDKDEDPELYQIVNDHMMHGPCGAERPSCPCTVNNKCTKKFLKQYLSACEAAWRIYGFDIHYRIPLVERLPFHLPNEQSVIFDERDSLDYKLDKAPVNETKFQSWMETNKTYTFAQKLIYVEFLKYYVWKHDEKFIYEKIWYVMATDVESIERVKNNTPELVLSDEQKKNYCLLYIQHMLLSNNKSLKSIPNMPYPTTKYTMDGYNRLVHDELSYNKDKLKEEHKILYVTLTEEQNGIYGTIMDSVDKNKGGMFFIYGYGRTGKTYLYKTMSAACRSQGGIVLNVASSGIAALLLEGGRTAHSRFAIPINVVEDSMCNISVDSELAELLRMTKLIIWDEAPMVNRHCYEVFDRKMRDICRTDPSTPSEQVFGGKVVMFGGDFRQILPVVPNGSRQDVVHVAINSSYLWNHCTVMKLTVNMRLGSGSNSSEKKEIQDFADWIINIRNGKIGGKNDGEANMEFPDDMLILDSDDHIGSIIHESYPDLLQNLYDPDYF
ncbi:DNA helicase PIF1, ATP-dependent [Tanacetum coccineum]